MSVIQTWYNQDLQKAVKVNHIDGNLFSHNGNGNSIGVRVYNDGEPVTLTGTVSGYVITSDGSTVPCTGARSGNEATITIPPAAYQPGNAFITIFLTDGSTVTTLCAAQTTVLQARTGSQVSPGSVVTDWTQTINAAMQSVEDAAENLGGIIATPYASLTYPVPLGKYTYYNNGLYRCISPISASEEFTAAHWTQVKLGDDVSELKSAIDYNDDKTDGTLKGIENLTDSVLLFDWEHGGIKTTDGTTTDDGATDRSRDSHYYSVDDVISVTNNSGVAVYLMFYTYSEGTYTFTNATGVADGSTYTFTTGQYFRIDCRGGFDKARLVTGVARYEIVEKIHELVNQGNIINSSVKAVTNKITEETQETVTAGTLHDYMLANPILRGTTFTFYNESSNASMNVKAIKIDGSVETLSDSVGYGTSATFTVNYDIYGIRNYVGNTDWHIKIEYGNTGKGSIVFYSVDQSSDLSTSQKQTARNNIGAASQSDMTQVQSDITIDVVTDIFGATLSNGYIKWSDGTTDSISNGKYSDYIAVETGDVLTYDLHAVGGVGAVIACYDSSKNYQQSKSIKGTGNGSWQENTGTLTIESGTAYIRFATNSEYLTSDSLTKTQKVKIKDYIDDTYPDIVWNGKKWAAFGTSITDTSYIDTTFLMHTGKYVPYLVQMSGMKVTNYGIAGASFLSNIMNKVKSVDLSTFDLVTIEGAVNDHATSKPIGEVGDTGDTTFAGTIYQMANYVYSNSNATLVFITDHVGRYVHINPAPDGSDFYGDCAPTKRNTLNLLQIDYINMIAKQCEYFGIPIIMAGQDAGINLMTGNQYLVDHIHQSYAGGHQYAQTIWSALKNIKPRIIPDD